MSSCSDSLSRMRSTAFSPKIVGKIDTRKSISLVPNRSLMRPSCGTRRSEMSRFDMIFRREMIAGSRRLGGDSISCSTPSMRKRMRNSFS